MAMLERLDLAEHAKKKVSELSKGMQQKLQFAVTVLHDPELIIIDEPFSGLDPVNSLVLKDLLLEFKAKGGSIVMSTHQMSQVEEMCDRLLMINKGQQKLYGPVGDIRQQYALHAIIVEGEGNWTTLPGVTRVETIENGRKSALLYLKPETTTDQILGTISNDIFIRVVEDSKS